MLGSATLGAYSWLVLTSPVLETSCGTDERVYIVQYGDTVWDIADAIYCQAGERLSAQRLVGVIRSLHNRNAAEIGPDPDRILPGMRLCLPREHVLSGVEQVQACERFAMRSEGELQGDAGHEPSERGAEMPAQSTGADEPLEVGEPGAHAGVVPTTPGRTVATVRRYSSGPSRKHLLGVELTLGFATPVVPEIYETIYRGSGVLRVAMRIHRGRTLLAPGVVAMGGQSEIRYSDSVQSQVVGAGGAGLDVVYFLLHRPQVSLGLGARAGWLFFTRRVDRQDIPIDLPERQYNHTFFLGPKSRVEVRLAGDRRLNFVGDVSVSYMPLRVDDRLRSNAQLEAVIGLSYDH